ncbi:flagellar hook-associated protein FlgK [Rhodoblastus sphagnicola]|uniref:Flagellar hook-associated protein 1 n=1 Tax=Rhodoblastus sphagnicola TaxID=333368 RepID=A0A2S6NCM9_9HYPH|nr:flagellar hook-associated protein FlgK [Rhodoblastus sphagnicola]MBB4199398.1 flagellar hook-associated protein 1 FlgK [Rhodoblastus sphagnicola]PPQ32373.1 flagellar hook-associated protein FlgK [Rhodoblastus sphagnicola]
MGLTNAMDIASSSLATNAGLQAIVSRNVSNAQNTTGYVSAKVANVITGANGAGIIESIANLTNTSLFNTMLAGTASNAAAQALSDGVTLLQKTVADSTTTTDSTTAAQSPSTLLQAMSSALQTYSSSPSNTSAAAAVVTAATNLANGLNDATTTTQNARETADQDMVTSVATITNLLKQFQGVNTTIVQGTASGSDITDALDQRSTLLQSLSKEIGISTLTNSNGSMSIYTDSGVTLFETSPRTVTMTPQTSYTASVAGNAVYVDGVPVTGSSAVMPIQSGALKGYADVRDSVAVTYQNQLDSIAGGLINAFAETGGLGPVAGLFRASANTATIPTATVDAGLAGSIQVSAGADPSRGGSYTNIRDGSINGVSQNSTPPAASFNTLLRGYISNLSSATTYPSGTALSTSSSLTSYASDSASWLNSKYQGASNDATYHTTLLSQTSQALSNATGVNIDQQMSKMLEFENAYQASAKLISTINAMFGSLLQAVA